MSVPNFTWQTFIGMHDDPHDVFQTFSKRFFCAECGIDSSIPEDPDTFPGVECAPILHQGLHKSFQAKFSNVQKVLYDEFENSLETAIKYKLAGSFNLDVIHFYTNGPPPTPKLDKNQHPTESRREQLDKIASHEGIKIEWRFGKNILEKLDAPCPSDFEALRKFFFVPGAQPKLSDPRSGVEDGAPHYHYSSQTLPYVSRSIIESQINEFLNSSEPLLWCPIIGAAGIGKSRLILNVCENLGPNWNWGWWSKGSSFDFSQWDPDRPTLLVVDYVMGRLQELEGLFDSLIASSAVFTSPVRIILAERLAEPWIKLLCQQPTIGPKFKSAAFTPLKDGFPVAIDLADMTADEKTALAESVLTLFPDTHLKAEELINETSLIDASCRPLIMWLVADRMSEGFTLPDIQTLLRENIELQRLNRWIPDGVTKDHEFLAAVATITGGVPLDPAAFQSDASLQLFSECDTQKHELIVSRKCEANKLHPFEPDVIGELHALDVLQGLNPLDPGRLAEAIQISAGVDGGGGAIGFLFRAASDFPSHPVLATVNHTNLMVEWFGSLSQFLVIALVAKGPNQSRIAAWKVIDSIRIRLVNSPPPEQLSLMRSIGVCAVNISYGSQNQNDFNNVVAIEKEVHNFAEKTGDAQLLDYHSKAASNLIRNNNNKYSKETVRLNIANSWLTFAKKTENYPVEAWRQLFSTVDMAFGNAVNAQTKGLPNPDHPENWFPLVVEAVDFASDPIQCDISFSSTIGRCFEKLNQAGEFDQACAYVSALIEHIADAGAPTQGGIAALIWTDIQKQKNAGTGNPHSPDLLTALAEHDTHAETLISHI